MAYPFPFVAGNILTAAELNALQSASPGGIPTVTGFYYSSLFPVAQNVFNPVYQRQYFMPVIIPNANTMTATRIGVATDAGNLNAGTHRLGIYQDSNGTPGTVLLDAGTIAVVAGAASYEITISQTLSAGIYWLSIRQETIPNISFFSFRSTSGVADPYGAFYQSMQTNLSNRSATQGWYRTLASTGAFTNATPAVLTQNISMVPRVQIKV